MEKRKVNILKNWSKNPRSIKDNDYDRLKTQIRDLGIYKPLLITEDGTVLGGNMRIRAFKELGIDEVAVTVLSFKKQDNGLYWAYINGVRDGAAEFKTEEEGMLSYALSDNDRAGFYDEDLLANLIPDYPDFEWDQYAVDLGEPQTLDKLIDSFKEVEEDEVPEVSEGEPESKLGEVYQLGRHRLMCGDATKIEDVEKLMNGQKADMVFTDPPYGVSYASKNEALNAVARGNRIQTPIENDHKSVEEMYKLWLDTFANINTVSKEGFSYYVCSPQGGELMMMMMMALKDAGIQVKHTIIWVKNNIVIGRSDYHYKHEPILYGWGNGSHQFYGGRTKNSVWEFDKPLKSDLHPTMKPIALVAEALNNSSKSDDIILDLFGGSGSTLIACEQTNRTCYMMELDPKYCDVIRKRYENFVAKDDKITGK